MGNRYCRRPGKFYTEQVEQILALIKRNFKDTGIDINKYLALCEQLGEEPDPEKMPPDIGDFPLEVQQAFIVHSLLPDRWEGMSGAYMGKDLSALGEIFNIYDIEDKRTVLYFLSYIIRVHSEFINQEVQRKQKQPKQMGSR